MTTAVVNPYLDGNFAPARSEITASRLLVGSYPLTYASICSNGPNPEGRYHWFDGDGMLHGVHLGNGTAQYRNHMYKHRDGRWRGGWECYWTGLSPPTGQPLWSVQNTANTALVWHSGRLLALWEGVSHMKSRCLDWRLLDPTYRNQLKLPSPPIPKWMP